MDLRFDLVDEKFNLVNEKFNLVDEKFNRLNDSINQLRRELSDFQASHEERLRYLERERMEASMATPAEADHAAAADKKHPRVAASR